MKRRSELTEPRQRGGFDLSYDPEAFGQFSEGIARFLGTARFLDSLVQGDDALPVAEATE